VIRLNKNQKSLINKSFCNKITNEKPTFHIIRKNLGQSQIIEFNKLKKLSKQLIVENCDRNPKFSFMKKTANGYSLQSRCHKYTTCLVDCFWNININIYNNEAILFCSINCPHKQKLKVYFNFNNLYIKY